MKSTWPIQDTKKLHDLYNTGVEMVNIYEQFQDRTRNSVNSKIHSEINAGRLEKRETARERAERLEREAIERENKGDMNDFSRKLKPQLRETGLLFGKEVVYVGKSYVVVQGKHYRETLTYVEIRNKMKKR